MSDELGVTLRRTSEVTDDQGTTYHRFEQIHDDMLVRGASYVAVQEGHLVTALSGKV